MGRTTYPLSSSTHRSLQLEYEKMVRTPTNTGKDRNYEYRVGRTGCGGRGRTKVAVEVPDLERAVVAARDLEEAWTPRSPMLRRL